MTTTPIAAGPNDVTVRARFWMTRESEWRLANGGNSKGAVPVHGKPSSTAVIPLYDQAALDAAVAAEREACKEACRKIAAQYPTDVWPEDGESLDCKIARMARLTAANCEREIDMRSNAELCGPREAD